jgi:hypothetical protein
VDFKTEGLSIDLHLLSDGSNLSDNLNHDIDIEMRDESPVSFPSLPFRENNSVVADGSNFHHHYSSKYNDPTNTI